MSDVTHTTGGGPMRDLATDRAGAVVEVRVTTKAGVFSGRRFVTREAILAAVIDVIEHEAALLGRDASRLIRTTPDAL